MSSFLFVSSASDVLLPMFNPVVAGEPESAVKDNSCSHVTGVHMNVGVGDVWVKQENPPASSLLSSQRLFVCCHVS